MNRDDRTEFWTEQSRQFGELVRLWIAHEQTCGHRLDCDDLRLMEQFAAQRHPQSLRELIVAAQSFLSLVKGVVDRCECHPSTVDDDRYREVADANRSERVLQESLEETFPASDPPSWTGTHA